MQELTIACSNDLCNCSVIAAVDDDEVYCSDFCRNLTEESLESESCSCGQPQCDAL